MTLAQTPMVTAASELGFCMPPRSMSASRRPQTSHRIVMAVALISPIEAPHNISLFKSP
jgi:hypothetical protein